MSARLVVAMTPTDKNRIEKRAKQLAMTPSQLVRQAALHYEPEKEYAKLDIPSATVEGLVKDVTTIKAQMSAGGAALQSRVQALQDHEARLLKLETALGLLKNNTGKRQLPVSGPK